ncbi:hypothetical protein DQ238_14600 [Geodermatophilus sp. TF02-6]|uniref:hypothetical protein n=1 Tax=Geodermatophilus sp. TF02-6 TaxID=2250575 RepID=UPI000DE837A0|nr:hypothetical protein [Geodermatophilus sp. TF02-6]RBY77636.1 hypothetical protein DQ238_14600 [Geodermatophilus sp. TF02-6]
MLFWPTVAVVGFLALTGVVIVLGAGSTARYEAERRRVREQAQPPAVPSGGGQPPAGGPAAPGGIRRDLRTPHPPGGAATEAGQRSRTAVGVLVGPDGEGGTGRAAPPRRRRAAARRQSGRRTPPAAPAGPDGTDRLEDGPAAGSTTVGWWLATELRGAGATDGRAVRAMAGPFGDRVDADWAALAGGLPASAGARAVYGVRRPDGTLSPRTEPEERAWFAELGSQLDRLAEDWDVLVSDTDPTTTLVVEVAAALLEAGLPLHDCDGSGPAGGVCLVPDPAARGILVSWRQHDRMSRQQVRGAAPDAAVQQAMNAAVADVLTHLGFAVEPLGSTGCHLVAPGQR